MISRKKIKSNRPNSKKNAFHWEEDTWTVIGRFFDQPNVLAHNQIDSYNDFVDNIIPGLIQNHNPIEIGHPRHWNPVDRRFQYLYQVEFDGQPYMSRPQINEGSGSIKNLHPSEARYRNLSYSAHMYLNVTHRILEWNGTEYVIAENIDTHEKLEKKETRIPFKLPAMIHSKYCYLHGLEAESLKQMGECPFDVGGYFVINGSEKVIIPQERPVDNKVLCFKQKESGSKYDNVVEIRSTKDQRFYPVRVNSIGLTHAREGEADQYLRINFPYLSKDIPLMIAFRALGIVTEKEIMEMILGCPESEANSEMIQLITPSMEETFSVETDVEESAEASTSAGVESTSRRRRKVPKTKITTQHDALLYIAKNINNMNMEYLEKKLGGQRPSDQERTLAKAQYVLDILRRDLLPHIEEDFRLKSMFLAHMCNILLKCTLGLRDYDIRDRYDEKRLDLAGPLLKKQYQGSFGRLNKDIKKEVLRTLESDTLSLYSGLRKVIQNCNMEAPIKKALSTGDWSTGKSSKSFASSTHLGIAQVLQRQSYLGTLSYLRRIQTPMEKAGNKITEPRKLDPTQFGMVCPNETPEGQQVGIVKNMSMTTSITISSSTMSIKAVIRRLPITQVDELPLTQLSSQTKVFLNGEWVGSTTNSQKVYQTMKRLKRDGTLNPKIGVSQDFPHREIHIRTDGGRYTRPLYVVTQVKKGTKRQWIPKIELEWDQAKKMTWKELIANGYVEYLDCDECENAMIALNYQSLVDNTKSKSNWRNFTHLELHPSMMHGVVAQMIPFPDHNVSPRNCFQSSMGKQAIGVPFTNFNSRMDTMANILCYPMIPIVQTRTMKYTNMDRLPHGQQCIVAVACYGGYNQEDSVLMNKAAIERGLFNSIYLKTSQADENPHKSSSSESEQFGKPDPSVTEGMKLDPNFYRNLDEDGFIKIGSKVEVNDVIIGKTVKKPEPTKSFTGQLIKYQDISTQIKHGEEGYVDMRIPSPGSVKNLNSDNNKFCKVRISQYRRPVIGDKVASRSAQKGTVGLTIHEEDMPFTDSGLIPDIIMNPHALPSRMTVAQMLETIFGKVGCLDAEIQDATPFTHFDQEEIGDILEKKYGFERNGEEIMYNGYTGEQFPTSIFIGPVYYQRLKHMVKDKVHARATGRVNNMTRQSVEGRSHNGGLRLGEMERDVLIAHGISQFAKESFMDRSDKFRCYVGKDSETIVVGNPDKGLFMYDGKYLNPEEVGEVQLPYAMKLLIQELTSMGIDFRIMLDQED